MIPTVACRLSPKESPLIILGAVLLIIGFIAKISILWTIGLVLIVVGAVLAILGGTGRRVGGRAHWF
jgi:membrane-bound ClpP family serine protease